MSRVQATPATLDAVIASVQPGDTVVPAAGAYGDVWVRKVVVGSPVVIAPAPGAVFRSLNVNNSAGLVFQGLTVRYTPDAKTLGWSAALTVTGSHDIAFSKASVIGGPAVNGVAETATALDNTANVIGRPAGYGVNIVQSQRVDFTDGEVAQFHRLIVMNALDGGNISRNSLHDRRTTAIQGAEVSNVTIDGNTIRDANPWRWGQTPVGDHADCMAFWSNANQTHPNAGLKIINNLMEQTAGAAILGMWLQGTPGGLFTGFEITGNTFNIPNLQGIALWNATNGLIANNTLVQTQVVSMTDEQKEKQRPTILLRAGVTGVTMMGNKVSAPISDQSGGANTVSGTVLLSGSYVAPVDPRDAQITDLTAKLAASAQALTDAKAAVTQAAADNAALTKRWADLAAGLKALAATTNGPGA